MDVQQCLYLATNKLAAANIETARLDCLILLEDMLGKDRALLLAHPEIELSVAQVAQLNTLIARRVRHEPLAYLRGKAVFYGREFAVNNKVLVPRPESESIVSLLKTLPLPRFVHIADLGTGSGCLGITAALELPDSRIYVYDIDPAALEVAQQNAQTYKVLIHTAERNLLKNCVEHFDVILANLPYVPDQHGINMAARHEPQLALFGGTDGLDIYRGFWEQADQLPAPPQYIITESWVIQHAALEEQAKAANYTLTATQGLAQAFIRLQTGALSAKRR